MMKRRRCFGEPSLEGVCGGSLFSYIRKTTALLAVAAIVLFTACDNGTTDNGNNNPGNPGDPGNPDVYFAGYADDKPVYWKNGTLTTLPITL